METCKGPCRRRKQTKHTNNFESDQEVSSLEWEFISMTKQEEDLIYRMFTLVGERWDLIAGRIPGRTAEEIERFWTMRHHDIFAERRKKLKIESSKVDVPRN
ncbi:Octamer-binding transcription factor [Parasponia andersonii]|uniref:Octamer-binding transcription factor n=1 Tax=Parasponia andersonii TaxID=3476 RepID=A0A2P5BMS5_PARAD|nr:Octamer-binding transcription factor [Parasponia andersonii]